MSIRFESIIKSAQKKGPKKIAVAAAEDREVLQAVKEAEALGLIQPILFGDLEKIRNISDEIQFNLDKIELINERDPSEAASLATHYVGIGKADILMKGLVDTSSLMKHVLNKDRGLRGISVISHVALFEVETYHKLFLMSDGAMILAPDLKMKKEIIENAVRLALKLGIQEPKVAVLAAKEKVDNKMKSTLHAKELALMNARGDIADCIVDGPFALDNAISKESANVKNITSPVAGDADILIVHDIEAGNILYKSLTFLAKAKSAGIILGAKAPIVLTSRADNEEAKLNSIALGVLML